MQPTKADVQQLRHIERLIGELTRARDRIRAQLSIERTMQRTAGAALTPESIADDETEPGAPVLLADVPTMAALREWQRRRRGR